MIRIKNNLYLGDLNDIKKIEDKSKNTTQDKYKDIEVILNLSGYSPHRNAMDMYTWLNIPMKDGKGSQHTFNIAAQNAVNQIKTDKTVLINCAAGISRSTGVIATAIAHIEGKTFSQAMNQLKKKQPAANPDQGIKEHAEKFLQKTQFTAAGETRQ
jgi:protein-tyrosine phosphatase